MKTRHWITVRRNGSARLTKRKPEIDADEVSIQLALSLPDELFTKPQLQAEITVPTEVVRKEVIDASITDNVQEAIHQATGLSFAVSVVPDGEPE